MTGPVTTMCMCWACALGAVVFSAAAWWWLRRAIRTLSAQLAVLTLAVHDVRDALVARDAGN